MALIDSEKLKPYLDAIANAETVRDCVHDDWRKLDEVQKLKLSAAFGTLIEGADRSLNACARLVKVLTLETERAAKG